MIRLRLVSKLNVLNFYYYIILFFHFCIDKILEEEQLYVLFHNDDFIGFKRKDFLNYCILNVSLFIFINFY